MKLSTALPVTTSGTMSAASNNARPTLRAALSFPLLLALTSFWNSTCKGNISLSPVTSRARDVVPQAVVVGTSTYRSIHLVLHGHLDVFTIQFQPSGEFIALRRTHARS